MLTITIPASENPRGKYTTFHCSDRFAQAIAQLRAAHAGIAWVHGYKPSTNWKLRPTNHVCFQFAFIVSRLYNRQIEAMREIKLADLDLSKWVPSKGPNAFDNAEDQFTYCVNALTESKVKSLRGELENAHTEAHDRNYCGLRNSVKVNFVTEKDPETGKRVPVLDEQGIPTVASILIPYLEIRTINVEQGERKSVNSGSKVLMDNAINKALSKRLNYKMLSLKDENFDRVVVGDDEIERENSHEI